MTLQNKSVRTRIAPSPTGDPHVGTAYMALFNYVFAKRFGGKFLLRIEDTDQTRSRPEYEKSIFDALHWMNIQWDEGPDVGGPFGPYRQSERTEIYRKYCQMLLDNGTAYYCFATPEELAEIRAKSRSAGHAGFDSPYRNCSKSEIDRYLNVEKRKAVVRLKVPREGSCVFEDKVKGVITTPWADIDDQVLLKADGFPTYHLANVVDDHLMEITHVIRGDEWISSTPKHILLYDSFGWTPPEFYHMPLLLGPDGKKLSKRRNPTSIFYYRDSGYLPEAFSNFLTLMGYSMKEDREIYNLIELLAEFDPARIGTSGAIFDKTKLEWLNQQYLLNNVPEDQLFSKIKEWSFSDEFMEKLIPLCRPRMKTFGDFIKIADFFFINDLDYTESLFTIGDLPKTALPIILQAIIWSLDEQEDWGKAGIEKASHDVANAFAASHKKMVMPLLFASLMAKKHGLPLYSSVELLGKDRTRARLLNAMEFCGGLSGKKGSALKSAWDSKSDLKPFLE